MVNVRVPRLLGVRHPHQAGNRLRGVLLPLSVGLKQRPGLPPGSAVQPLPPAPTGDDGAGGGVNGGGVPGALAVREGIVL